MNPILVKSQSKLVAPLSYLSLDVLLISFINFLSHTNPCLLIKSLKFQTNCYSLGFRYPDKSSSLGMDPIAIKTTLKIDSSKAQPFLSYFKIQMIQPSIFFLLTFSPVSLIPQQMAYSRSIRIFSQLFSIYCKMLFNKDI